MYALQTAVQFPDWRLSACGDLVQITVQLLIEGNVSLVSVAVVWLGVVDNRRPCCMASKTDACAIMS